MTSRPLAALLFIGCLTALSCLAQGEPDTTEFNGKWSVNLMPGGSHARAATLTVSDFAGVWLDLGSIKHDERCRGKKFPVTVQASHRDRFEFTVWGSAVSAACPDLSISLKPVSPSVLEGTVNESGVIRLTRR